MTSENHERKNSGELDAETPDLSRRSFFKGTLGAALAGTAAIALSPKMTMAAQGKTEAAKIKNIVGPVTPGKLISAKGYAAFGESQPLRAYQFERRAVGPNDVAIEIQYCGVCHSDIHDINGHWFKRQFPLVPGHEVAGVVIAVGSTVSRHKVGDRVGVGAMVDSCGVCSECNAGFEQYCLNDITYTYGSPTKDPTGISQGGYSNVMVVRDKFVIAIPDNMQLASVGPLMCAGITVYSPMRHWQIRPGHKIGIVGFGGLGHIAVKMAKALGAEIVVLTTSPEKVKDAKAFGASDVIVNYEPGGLKKYFRQLDFILDTVPYQHDMDPYMSLLKRDATLCLVGVGKSSEPNQLRPFTTVSWRTNFAGSQIGSPHEIQEAIDFCALNNIAPTIELIPIQQINTAWENVVKKKVRYRYVIDMTSLASEA